MMWWGHNISIGLGLATVALMVFFRGIINTLAIRGIIKFTKYNSVTKPNVFDIVGESYATVEIAREQLEELN